MPADLQDAIDAFGSEVVEAVLVQLHCATRPLSSHPDLAHLIDNDSPEIRAARQHLADWPVSTVDDLVRSFELLVPADDDIGAVFTPARIAEFMAAAALSGQELPGRVLDPACGCGALLVAALRYLHSCSGTIPSEIVNRQLIGIDVNQGSLDRCKVLLALTCASLGDLRPLTPTLVAADATTLVPSDVGGGCDAVLANPPYVRFQHLSIDQREDLATRFVSATKGNFNLYMPFFEVTASLLRPGGRFAIIAPNQWLTSLSGGPLRDWMRTNLTVEGIVDFGTARVFDALTYTAIVTGSTHLPELQPGPVTYLRASSAADLPDPHDWTRNPDHHNDLPPSGPWRLVGTQDRALMEAVAAQPHELATMADIRYGVATCRDRLFLLTEGRTADGSFIKTFNGTRYVIEEELTRPIVKASDVRSTQDIAANTLRIIYPYVHDPTSGAVSVVGERVLQEGFPNAYRYFLAIADELARRDKGKKTYAAWYAYGRTQGLVPPGEVLITPLYANEPRFMISDHPETLMINGCSVALRRGAVPTYTTEALGIMLNSSVCRQFVEATGPAIDGGFYSYQKSTISPFRVPALTADGAVELVELSTTDPAACDRAVRRLYGLAT